MVLKYVNPMHIHSQSASDPNLIIINHLDGTPAGRVKPEHLVDNFAPGLMQVDANIAGYLNRRAGLRGNFPFHPMCPFNQSAPHVATVPILSVPIPSVPIPSVPIPSVPTLFVHVDAPTTIQWTTYFNDH